MIRALFPIALAVVLPLGGVALLAPAEAATKVDARSERIVALLRERYVHPAGLAKVERKILTKSAQLAQLDDAAYAKVMGPELARLLRDRHVLLDYMPRPLPEQHEKPAVAPDLAAQERMAAFARSINYGFTSVAVREGNIGYLQVDGFMPPEVGGQALADAMDRLRSANALIIDLRQSVNGGDPAMVALICAYFTPDTGRLITTLSWRNGERHESRIPALDPAKRFPAKTPIYVLTSRATFSAGEELAYNLKALRRAVLIGEPTRGGANPGRDYRVTAHLQLFIPEGEAISALTGTNWNWTGVIPHESVYANKALDRAIVRIKDGQGRNAQPPKR